MKEERGLLDKDKKKVAKAEKRLNKEKQQQFKEYEELKDGW